MQSPLRVLGSERHDGSKSVAALTALPRPGGAQTFLRRSRLAAGRSCWDRSPPLTPCTRRRPPAMPKDLPYAGVAGAHYEVPSSREEQGKHIPFCPTPGSACERQPAISARTRGSPEAAVHSEGPGASGSAPSLHVPRSSCSDSSSLPCIRTSRAAVSPAPSRRPCTAAQARGA